jgi:hypothetical protein
MYTITKTTLALIILLSLSSCMNLGKNTQSIAPYLIPLNTGVKDVSFLTDMEREIIVYLNDVRTSPEKYADHLKDLKERPGWPARPESETPSAGSKVPTGMDETVLSLQDREPPLPFKVSKGLSLAARNLVQDLGPKGLRGHEGSDRSSPFERMNKYGQWEGKTVEILTYGYKDADALVTGMLADRSPTGREDRNSLFDKDYLIAGVSCATHKTYRTMCAIVFAQRYSEKLQNVGRPLR